MKNIEVNMEYKVGDKLRTNQIITTTDRRFRKGTILTIIHVHTTRDNKNKYKCLFPEGYISYFYEKELDKICEKAPKTNGDYIRSMTDEQLAEILVTTECGNCKKYDCNLCKDRILAWLKEENG